MGDKGLHGTKVVVPYLFERRKSVSRSGESKLPKSGKAKITGGSILLKHLKAGPVTSSRSLVPRRPMRGCLAAVVLARMFVSGTMK